MKSNEFIELIRKSVDEECSFDLRIFDKQNISYTEVPNLDCEGTVTSDYDYKVIFKLDDGIYAIEFNRLWGVHNVHVGIDCVEDIIEEFDMEEYLKYLQVVRENVLNLKSNKKESVINMDKKAFVELVNKEICDKEVCTLFLQSIEGLDYSWFPVLNEDGTLNEYTPEMFIAPLKEGVFAIKGNVDSDEEDLFYVEENDSEKLIESFEAEEYFNRFNKLKDSVANLFSIKQATLGLDDLVKILKENLGGDFELLTPFLKSVEGIEFAYIPNIGVNGQLDSKETVIAIFKTREGVYCLEGLLRQYFDCPEALFLNDEDIEDCIDEFDKERYMNKFLLALEKNIKQIQSINRKRRV